MGYELMEGFGRGDDPIWPPEKSLLILEIGQDDATALAKDFGQRAIVIGCVQKRPELLMLA
ncbi:MAG: DUF3293 domain-containing protein [Pyrinomonadaceae bacterium]|nr:DUF3293 domain-containing protein [Pyrinomonadaceae bacterium]